MKSIPIPFLNYIISMLWAELGLYWVNMLPYPKKRKETLTVKIESMIFDTFSTVTQVFCTWSPL